jgi:hypothetical protein
MTKDIANYGKMKAHFDRSIFSSAIAIFGNLGSRNSG